jgi:hypothetical protein
MVGRQCDGNAIGQQALRKNIAAFKRDIYKNPKKEKGFIYACIYTGRACDSVAA